ncbi:MAG: mechanosensitive ion channel family protein [Sediminibacterium sp.]
MSLDQQIWSNSIRSYLFIAGILLFTLLIKRLVSRFFASLIYTWVDKKNHSELRKSHVHRLLVPIEQFLLFLVAIIALYELKFPEAWDLKLFKLSLQQFIESGIKFIFILLLIRVSLRTLEFISIILENKARLTKDLSDDQLVLFFRDFFKVIIYIIGILMVLRYVFNESIGNLVTSLSIVGAAVALSTRESLENIIASFIIFFDKPFTIGDLVKVNGFTGTIEKIGLRSTRIRTQEKTYISVPNKQMVDSIVDNISLRSERKIEMDLQLSVQTSAHAIADFANHMRTVLSTQNGVNSYNVFVAESGKQFHALHIDCLVSIQMEISEFQMIRELLNLAAIEYANAHQIQFSENG